MRTVFFLVQKEFLQLRRNKMMLPLILVMPVFQLLLLSYAANYEVKNLALSVVDHDLSATSRQLAAKFGASGYCRSQFATTMKMSNRSNPGLDYKTFMVPGILGVIVSLIICFLTAMNIVREREIGTIEQLNVTPLRKWQFILGKLLPPWAQWLNMRNPVHYFVAFMRLVLFKGAGFADIRQKFFTVLTYAVVVNGLAMWTCQKTKKT